MTETTKTAEPIWKRQPTTWKVADIYGPDLIKELAAGLDVRVRYTQGAKRKLYDDLRFVLEVEEMVDGMAMGGTDDA